MTCKFPGKSERVAILKIKVTSVKISPFRGEFNCIGMVQRFTSRLEEVRGIRKQGAFSARMQ
jgi:hypothetical protein